LAGAPILKYNVIDMERALELEFGVPTAEHVPGDGRVISGRLPAGRYTTILYRGPYALHRLASSLYQRFVICMGSISLRKFIFVYS
jgi:hypothetical protein